MAPETYLVVGDNFHSAGLPNPHAAVGGAKVDAYGEFAHLLIAPRSLSHFGGWFSTFVFPEGLGKATTGELPMPPGGEVGNYLGRRGAALSYGSSEREALPSDAASFGGTSIEM